MMLSTVIVLKKGDKGEGETKERGRQRRGGKGSKSHIKKRRNDQMKNDKNKQNIFVTRHAKTRHKSAGLNLRYSSKNKTKSKYEQKLFLMCIVKNPIINVFKEAFFEISTTK